MFLSNAISGVFSSDVSVLFSAISLPEGLQLYKPVERIIREMIMKYLFINFILLFFYLRFCKFIDFLIFNQLLYQFIQYAVYKYLAFGGTVHFRKFYVFVE